MKTAFIWREKPNSEKFSSVSRYIVVGRILQLNQIITVREWFTVIEQHESYERITFSLLHWETLKVVPMTYNLHPGALKRLARSCRTSASSCYNTGTHLLDFFLVRAVTPQPNHLDIRDAVHLHNVTQCKRTAS